MYNIISQIRIKNNTAVTINGNGEGLKNGIYIVNEKGAHFRLLSVALTHLQSTDDIGRCTDLLIEGDFFGTTFEIAK